MRTLRKEAREMRENTERLYKVDDQLKATIDVYITHERKAPSIRECRYAVLQLNHGGYVVYDRLLCRIVNGVFWSKEVESALHVAQLYNEGHGAVDMAPNGLALGLIYPCQYHDSNLSADVDNSSRASSVKQ
jgi:hypothetical protein